MTINEISIGDGATRSVGSDCYPYTVVAKTAQTVTIQRDNYKPAEGHNYFGDQKYIYWAAKDGATEVIRFRKGVQTKSNRRVHFGSRRYYSDPSF